MIKRVPIIKWRYISVMVSALFIVLGLVFFFINGFNLGIDFDSGLSERVQIAPVGAYVRYTGSDGATLSIENSELVLNTKGQSYRYSKSEYKDIASLANALNEVDGIEISIEDGSLLYDNFISGFGFPKALNEIYFPLNFSSNTIDVEIEDIREALKAIPSASVQNLSSDSLAIFQIKVALEEGETAEMVESRLNGLLGNHFGKDSLVVLQSDFVGPKFSSTLITTSITAVLIAVIGILIYVWVRFTFSYAISAIIALFHDVICMIAFIVIFKVEVSATTIAAILTIIGYSLNNTIVIFDRIRENVEENLLVNVDFIIETSVAKSLTRTILTSITTLLAVIPLCILATGTIQLFAINLTFGIVIGTYSSNLIAPSLLHWFNNVKPINVPKKKKDEDKPEDGIMI